MFVPVALGVLPPEATQAGPVAGLLDCGAELVTTEVVVGGFEVVTTEVVGGLEVVTTAVVGAGVVAPPVDCGLGQLL